MSLLANSNAIESGGYNIDRSLRFRSSASAYLSRTPSVAGNRKTWTWSAWVKRGNLATGANQTLFAAGNGTSSDWMQIYFEGDTPTYQLGMRMHSGSSNVAFKLSTQVFRDPAAWYHLVVVFDSTQATASNRIAMYVNGVQVTSFASTTDPSLNLDGWINSSSYQHTLSSLNYSSRINYFDGYLTEVNFIDGQALGPEHFGQVSAETGVWVPKKYTGTYGTNGFYLDFKDNTSATTLAYDKSGNGNNWTPNNISTTAGATYDSMTDVPTLTSATAANYCVLNPLDIFVSGSGTTRTFEDGNLKVTLTNPSGVWSAAKGTGYIDTSVPLYFEVNFASGSAGGVGVCNQSSSWSGGAYDANAWGYVSNGNKSSNGNTAYGSSYTSGASTIIGVAVSGGNIWFSLNGTWQASGNPSTGANPAFTNVTGPITVLVANSSSSSTNSYNLNMGQRPFSYTPPTGFKALCTANLPEVPASLLDPTDHHIDITVTKSGDTNFTLPWDASVYDTFFEIKRRDAAGDWYQIDGLRGYDKILKSNSTAAETTDANVLGVSGTTCTLKSTLPNGVYIISATKAGLSSARQTNTDGSITSTVSRNVVSGFAIVTYTGTGAGSATVGHGLGVAPSFVIVKQRDAGGALYAWNSYHISLGGGSYVQLNTTSAAASDIYVWSNTAPSSTVITLGSSTGSYNQVNNYSGCRYVAYCYADSAIQKSFSYKGNGSTDGPYVNLGFKCGSVLIKETSTSSYSWNVMDTARDTYNTQGLYLFANTNAAEGSASYLDFLALGFKPRNLGAGINGSTLPYIGHAWAAVTGKYSNAR